MKTISHTSHNGHTSHAGSSSEDMGDLAQLRADVTNLMHTAAGVGGSAMSAVRETAAGAVDGIKDQLSELKDKTVKSGKTLAKQFRVHPLAGTLIALGVGYLMLRMIVRKKS